MKKSILFLAGILIAMFTKAQEIYIPDNNFRLALIASGIDENKDGLIQESEVFLVEKINVANKNIASLQGIQKFINLIYLDCSNNNLGKLDLTNNQTLQHLQCNNNKLTALDLSQNVDLTFLDCFSNKLASINLKKNRFLTKLDCHENVLDSINVSNCLRLTSLYCNSNKLTALDISHNAKLNDLNCEQNNIGKIIVNSIQEKGLKGVFKKDESALLEIVKE